MDQTRIKMRDSIFCQVVADENGKSRDWPLVTAEICPHFYAGMEWGVLEVVHRQLPSAGAIARIILNSMPGEKLNSQASLAWDLSDSGLADC